jgi:hypothetical protein
MLYAKSTGGFYDRAIHGDNIPADAVEITEAEHAALIEGQSMGKVIVADENGRPILQDPPPPTAEQIVAQYTAAVQKHLDDFARTRGYDGILSAATYATSTVPKFKAEGQYAVEARDATWAKCYEVLAAVESGSRPMPTLDELLAELPVLTWPN